MLHPTFLLSGFNGMQNSCNCILHSAVSVRMSFCTCTESVYRFFGLTSALFYYCLHRTCESVDFKRGRHAGNDGGQVGQLRHSSVPSSHRCHLNPSWKDNRPQHNAFCTYSCPKAAVIIGRAMRKIKTFCIFIGCLYFSFPM